MLFKHIPFFFLLLVTAISSTQNYIPNADFENCTKLGKKWMGTRSEFDASIVDWVSPIDGSPDILFDEALPYMFPPRSNVDMTGVLPHSGRVMLGIKTYGCAENWVHCKEYVEVELTEALTPGAEYKFSVWLKRLYNSTNSNDLGFILSDSLIFQKFADNLFDFTPYQISDSLVGSDGNGWQQFSYTFKASRPSKYISFGNFLPDNLCTVYDDPKTNLPYTFWLLDDFSLVEIKKANILLNIPDVSFNFNESQLKKEGEVILEQFALDFIEKGIQSSLTIRGHTDNIGNENYNQNLSLARAKTVVNFLQKKGLSVVMTPEGMGSQAPVANNDTEEGRASNRRVVILSGVE